VGGNENVPFLRAKAFGKKTLAAGKERGVAVNLRAKKGAAEN